jgi:ABC-type multidrug transport system fused ATPase/permease subunit
MNYMAGNGMAEQGLAEEAARVRADTARLIVENGFAEYFSPEDGTPAGGATFTWTAAVWLAWASPKSRCRCWPGRGLMGAIELKSVEKWFGEVQVIKGVDLSIADGEFVIFVGPSGCGKSTLLRMIAGLEETSRGQVVIDGRDATAEPPSKRGLAMVFQSYALYPHMSVARTWGSR